MTSTRVMPVPAITNQADVYTVFDKSTGTWQYIVADPVSREAVIIDPVLDFDLASHSVSTENADSLLLLVSQHQLEVRRIMETHVHADHLTAATYLQHKLQRQGYPRPDICIGARIIQVQATFASKYQISTSELDHVFDTLFQDGAKFAVGNICGTVVHLPGHTPDHVGYVIGEAVFTGDSMFNPDVGSARADFPGGSATDLYNSSKVLLGFPDHYRLYTGHDYPPATRESAGGGDRHRAYSTVKEQKDFNKHFKLGTTKDEFVKLRSDRDATLGNPKLLHQALQFNIRAGRLPQSTHSGDMFVHVPLTVSEGVKCLMHGSEH